MKLKRNLMFFLIVIIVLWVFYSFIFGKIYFLLFWNEEYPYSLKPLSNNELQILKQEFESVNDPPICNKLNEYGFVGRVEYYNCQRYEIKPTKIKLIRSSGEIIEMIRYNLVKNSKFTGVLNKDRLDVEHEFISYGCLYRCMQCEGLLNCTVVNNTRNVDSVPLSLIAEFKNQFYNGIEVENTKLRVSADERGIIAITGHRYYNISAPVYPRISKQEARIKLSGMRIPWYAGLTGTKGEYIIKGTERLRFEKLIYPYNNPDEEKLEFRLIWKIMVSGMYNVYMDAITGEVLKTEQLWVS